ncbi:hypothetical protein D9M69_579920 [compost metagenome]
MVARVCADAWRHRDLAVAPGLVHPLQWQRGRSCLCAGDPPAPDRGPLCRRVASPRTVLVFLHQRNPAVLATTGAGAAMAGAGLAPSVAKTRRPGLGVARLGGTGGAVFLHQHRQAQVVHLPGAAWAGAGRRAVDPVAAHALVQTAPAYASGVPGTGGDLVRVVVRPWFHRTAQGRHQR